MALERISERVGKTGDGAEAQELRFLLEAFLDGLRAITLKLDADAGVTDTNYTAVLDANIRKS